ncbi:MAG: GntR family transcriptional regulator, partial [Burkholderiaceae bacterium]|nr:GntR family transcriptional regulator [Burkholderiaceae bacterium]
MATVPRVKPVGSGAPALGPAAAAAPVAPAAAATSATPAPREVAPAFSPLYQQIKALLTSSLQGGEWRPGELIPSETELAARFKVSQGTVRKAIDALADENLLVRRQGK